MTILHEWILALDLGTSSLKAIAVNRRGQVLAEATQPYPIYRPQEGWAEQNPEEWWQAACRAINILLSGGKIKADGLQAISLCGQMHGTVTLDKSGNPLCPAIIWADGRSTAEIELLLRTSSREELLSITGSLPNTGYTALNLLWIKRNQPEIWSAAQYFLLPKDYLGYRLTGKFHSEPSDASSTFLFDITTRQWSPRLLDLCGINLSQLPEIIESKVVRGGLTPQAATETGLPTGVLVVAGGGDTECSALALGVTKSTTLACNIGTAAQLFWPINRPVMAASGQVQTLCHVLPERWHLSGAILNGGVTLSWLNSLLSSPDYQTLLEEAATVPEGANNLFFLPYLQGERSPHNDPLARGVFFGLSMSHNRAHLARAVLEGVAFALCDCLTVFREIGAKNKLAAPDSLYLSGGGAVFHPLWPGIIADVFGMKVGIARELPGSAYGAIALAGQALGWWSLLSENELTLSFIEPDPQRSKKYAGLYSFYRELYPAMQPLFGKLNSL
jgi:xylulokinase